jgi:hypothetical protein
MAENRFDARLDRLLKTAENEFKDHAQTVLDFNKMQIGAPTSNLDRELLSVGVTELLYGLLEQWSSYNNTASQWVEAGWKNFGHIIFVHAHDGPSNIGLHIGMSKEGFYLQMGAIPAENLPKMSNGFWLDYIRLSELGDLSLTEVAEIDEETKKEFPYLFPKNPGALFQIMRDIIAVPILNKFPHDLGDFCLEWPYGRYSIIEVLKNGCLAFELMYNMIRLFGKSE